MPRLPDYTALGEPKAPNISTSVPSYDPPTPIGSGIEPGLAKFSAVLKEIETEREKDDLLRAEDGYNELKLSEVNLRAGDDGYLNKKGKDAVNGDVVKNYGNMFREKQAEIASGLSNDRQRENFRRRSDIAWINHQSNILNHVAKEKEAYKEEVSKNTQAIEYDEAINNYDNVNIIQSSIARTKATIDSRNLSPEAAKEEKTNAVSAIHRGVIERYLANEQDGGANAYYKAHKGEIAGKDIIYVENKVKEGNIIGEAYRVSDAISKKYGADQRSAMEALEKLPGKLRARATPLVEKNIIFNRTQEARQLADDLQAKNYESPELALKATKNIADAQTREQARQNIRSDIADKNAIDTINKEDLFNQTVKVVQSKGRFNREDFTPKQLSKFSKEDVEYFSNPENFKTNKVLSEDREKARLKFHELVADPEALFNLPPKDFNVLKNQLDPKNREALEIKRADLLVAADKSRKELRETIPKNADLAGDVKKQLEQAGIVTIKEDPAHLTVEEKRTLGAVQIAVERRIYEAEEKKAVQLTVGERQKIIDEEIKPHVKVTVDGWTNDIKPLGRVTLKEMADYPIFIPKENISERAIQSMLGDSAKTHSGHVPSDSAMQKAYSFLLVERERINKLKQSGKIEFSSGDEEEMRSKIKAKYLEILKE